MIEVELKFEIDPAYRAEFQAALAVLPTVRSIGQSDNVDRYYDTASFYGLRQAVFMRIRNHAQLEMKFHEHADLAHTHSTERVFPLESGLRCIDEMNMLCA